MYAIPIPGHPVCQGHFIVFVAFLKSWSLRTLACHIPTAITLQHAFGLAKNTYFAIHAQARERLLSKVKADQERLKHLDARLIETAEVVAGMKQRMEDLESDMKSDKKGDVSQNKVCVFV